MPAITVGFEEFETRLDRVRRRLHQLAIADAVCISASAVFLAASVVIVAAFAAGPGTFAWLVKLAVTAAIAALAGATWRLWTNWHSLYETALYVDRTAGLEARVATLLAHPTSPTRSPLRSLLLWQIFDLAPRWEVDRIAPLRLGRPAVALAVALATLLATALLVPDPEHEPPAEVATRGATSSSAAVEERVAGGPGADSGATRSQAAELEGSSTTSSFSADRGSGDLPDPGRSNSPGGLEKTANRDSRGLPDEGAKPTTDLDPSRIGALPEPPKPNDFEPAPAPALDQKAPKAPHAAPATTPRKQTGANQQTPPSGKDRPRAGKKGGSKAALANPRKGESSGTRGLLAEEGAKPLPVGKSAKPMVIQLKAFAVQPAEQLEPQGRPSGEDGAANRDPEAAPAPLASSQVEDSVLQRSVVTRVHRDLIRDLFTPEQR